MSTSIKAKVLVVCLCGAFWCVRIQDISNDLREPIVTAHQGHFQTIWDRSFYSEKDYSYVESFQDSSKVSEEWKSQHIHKFRQWVNRPEVNRWNVKTGLRLQSCIWTNNNAILEQCALNRHAQCPIWQKRNSAYQDTSCQLLSMIVEA